MSGGAGVDMDHWQNEITFRVKIGTGGKTLIVCDVLTILHKCTTCVCEVKCRCSSWRCVSMCVWTCGGANRAHWHSCGVSRGHLGYLSLLFSHSWIWMQSTCVLDLFADLHEVHEQLTSLHSTAFWAVVYERCSGSVVLHPRAFDLSSDCSKIKK